MNAFCKQARNISKYYFPAMKYLLLALFGECWSMSIKDKDIFKPLSDEMIEYINKYSGANRR